MQRNSRPADERLQRTLSQTLTVLRVASSAGYRIVIQGWTKEEAIAEMTDGGFGFHSIWSNLVDYLRELDVARLKRASGGGSAFRRVTAPPAEDRMR
jgi:hypothetical protein